MTRVAQSTIAKDSRDVLRLLTAASEAAADGGNAQSVADAVYSATKTAPREAREFGDSTFRVNGNRFSVGDYMPCLLYTSPSPRDATLSRMPSSA